MKEIKFDFSIGSDVDYKNLVADIGFDNNLVVLLTQEEGFENMRIKIYSNSRAECWDFKLEEFEDIIKKAKEKLWILRRKSE